MKTKKFQKTEETEMKNEKIPYKVYLSENEMPKVWYNLSRHKKEAGTALEPRHTRAYDGAGTFRCVL